MNVKRTQTVVVQAAVVTLLLMGCSGTSKVVETTSTPESGPVTSDRGTDVASPEGEQESQDIFMTVYSEGALSAPYGAPTLDEFANSTFVVDVVLGTVRRAEPFVTTEATTVYTMAEVEVQAARAHSEGQVLSVRETGGVVRLQDVAKDFEARLSPDQLAQNADALVDYRLDGQEHSRVGDTVLVFVAGNSHDLFAAARLKLIDGTFQWVGGEPPNPSWKKSLTDEEARALTRSP